MVQPNPGAQKVTLTGDELVDILGVEWQTATVQDIANLASNLSPVQTVTLDEDTPVTVANTNVTSNSIITFTLKTANTPGAYPTIQTITPGTGFTVQGSAGDTSVYNYSVEG